MLILKGYFLAVDHHGPESQATWYIWYAANMLKLNDDKTEMLVIVSKYRTISKLPDWNVGSTAITTNEHVRNLGVIMDTKFTMEPHITKIRQIAFLKIRQISIVENFWNHLLLKHSSLPT